MLLRSLALIAVAHIAFAAEPPFSAEVIGITDGDSIKVLHDGVPKRIRLWGIDSPELKQPFGRKAKAFTGDLAFGKVVAVRPRSRDRYGRIVAEVELSKGRLLNHEILRAGLAWVYLKYCKDSGYIEIEDSARVAQVGLWTDVKAVPPWEFRAYVRSRSAEPNTAKQQVDALGLGH